MIKKSIIYFFLLAGPLYCYSQSTKQTNVNQNYWKDYIGVYSNNKNTTVTISPSTPDKLIYTNLDNRQFLRVVRKEKDKFVSGDSLMIKFQRNKSGKVFSLIFQIEGNGFRAEKRNINFKDLKITSGKATISGTLITPGDEGPYPGVIMNGGASWTTRDTNVSMALYHVSHGRATFVYDKRG